MEYIYTIYSVVMKIEYLTNWGNIIYNVLGHKEKMNYGNMIRKKNEPPKVCQYQWGFFFFYREVNNSLSL